MRPRQWIHAATTALVAGLVVVVPAATTAHAAPSLPAGFLLDDIPTGFTPGYQGDFLTDFAFLPDESMLIVGKYGKVNWVPKTGNPRNIANIQVVGTHDLGLQGIAVAPDFATSRTVYTAGSAQSTGPGSGQHGVLRLSKWTVTLDSANNPIGLTNEQPILETSSDEPVHSMSTVLADEDGTLWVSIGDSSGFIGVDQRALRALDINDLHGKLLHIKPDGSGVASNPYYDAAKPNAVSSKVYASGFRSPFRFSLDPKTKRPILGDVGWNATEEINLVNPGNEYGWPCWEGNQRTVEYRDLAACAQVATVAPIWSYPRSAGNSVTGGVIYSGKNYPAEYQGRYFYGDYAVQRLFNMAFDASGNVTVPPNSAFGSDIGHVVKIDAMPTGGDIVYADIIGGTIRRLVYAPGNNAPVAVMSSTNEPATRKVTFNADKSWDPNGDELQYAWEFGDGTTGTGKTAVHTYPASPESFTAKLTVTDPLNKSASRTATVYPSNRAPELSLQAPDPNRKFSVGDVISATATATDPEEGQVQVSWTTDMVHCRGASNCHSHPGERQENASTFNLHFDGHAGDTRLEITATATDSKGASTSQTFIAKPNQRRVTIQSNLPAEFTIGEEQGGSALFTAGQSLTLVAPEVAANKVASFDKWGNNSTDRVHNLVVPDSDVTLNVTYLTPIDRRYNAEPGLRQILGTPTEVEQGDTQIRWREYAGGRLYWSPETGAHLLFGAILGRYLEFGGHAAYGVPSTDELSTADGRGRYNLFPNLRSIYWSEHTGAKFVWGMVYEKWDRLGRDNFNGLPTTDELATPDGVGRFNAFERGYIYWHPAVGASEIHGRIYERWASLGWERSSLGYPITDERVAADGIGRYNEFQGQGSIYWSPSTDAWEVKGGIRAKWQFYGGEGGHLGYPITNEMTTRDGQGRYNRFRKGNEEHSVYWHPFMGNTAYEVRGAIRAKWMQLGAEQSRLKYPVSDEFTIPNGWRSNFQGGYIIHRWGGTTTVTYY
ncbi:PQQ-dependent sugar dehydrogenase [Kibdelosporangium philippinense]|uniref:PQQ-dependent sugar dehydrogenase n=1 Tax=Kibdelosporangium philippinense TaxID=211113 RepID=A0ABS8ZFT1_9PSEU|nr:PQQ-dependent sugar dehydrogenase [Kibdelosporangium philippinense]MCE7006674.1 PQQ-dependent sugar dehydrogenase [Kibdelosporangium philippinense]